MISLTVETKNFISGTIRIERVKFLLKYIKCSIQPVDSSFFHDRHALARIEKRQNRISRQTLAFLRP